MVLICASLVKQLDLHLQKLPSPIKIELAMQNKKEKVSVILTEYVHLSLHDSTGEYSAQTVHAIVTPNLCNPVILGLPFLKHNKIVIDHDQRTAIDKTTGFDLLNPSICAPPKAPKKKLKDIFKEVTTNRKAVALELQNVCGRC